MMDQKKTDFDEEKETGSPVLKPVPPVLPPFLKTLSKSIPQEAKKNSATDHVTSAQTTAETATVQESPFQKKEPLSSTKDVSRGGVSIPSFLTHGTTINVSSSDETHHSQTAVKIEAPIVPTKQKTEPTAPEIIVQTSLNEQKSPVLPTQKETLPVLEKTEPMLSQKELSENSFAQNDQATQIQEKSSLSFSENTLSINPPSAPRSPISLKDGEHAEKSDVPAMPIESPIRPKKREQEATEKSEKSEDPGSSNKISSASEQATETTVKSDTTTPKKIDYKSPSFLKQLFANGNECITAPSGSFPVKEDVRALVALFSNGRFFVSETYKFDGKVLGFEYLAKKRRLQIGKPEYVPMAILESIYEYASHLVAPASAEDEEEVQEQARMQRDLITIVSRAAFYRVSDIHIVVADRTTVMFRINGLMQTEMEYNKEWGESFVRAAFASADISDSNYAQNEYQAAQKLGSTPLRGSGGKLVLPKNVLGIRLQFNPIAFGTRYVVMRLLYSSGDEANDSLEALGYTRNEADIFYKLRALPTGIVIISGPTGSGKSTTLQRNMIAMLKERNYETNLITVEDPPEYPIPGARQMPVTNATLEEEKDREFTKALAAALRSDPDSLMIGEIRTLSAADLAFRGALSGHNVWTTLHANNAPAILTRLKDMGVEDFKLQDPEIIRGLLTQRLFRRVCPHCRILAKEKPNHPAVARLYQAFGDIGLEYAYLRGPGCKQCDFRGVKGRAAVAEFILPDSVFLDLIIKGETQKAINYWINDLDGQTLREAAQARMLQGIIDIEEVERWTGFLNQQVLISS